MDFDVTIEVEEVDLAQVAAMLRERFEGSPPVGYVPGRTALRDAVSERLGCSSAEAERLVDTMASRGFLRFQGDPTSTADSDEIWVIRVVG